MSVPHHGNMRLWFSPDGTIAYYRGDAHQSVCKDSRAPGGNWTGNDGTMDVEITTLLNGRKHVRAWFKPDPRSKNLRYAVSGLVFNFTLKYGDVEFRLNY